MRVTTAAGSMPLGVFTHETVFDRIEASGNISSPIAANPRRSAPAATSWRRNRCASPFYILPTLSALEMTLRELGYRSEAGAGVAAAQAIFADSAA